MRFTCPSLRPLVLGISFAVLACCCLSASVPCRGQDRPSAVEPLPAAELLKLGDRLASEKKYDEALLHYKDAYEQLVPRIRKRDFKHPVRPRLMQRAELRDYMLQELTKEVTPEEMTLMDRSLKAFGLVPMHLDVKETLVRLLTEEVGGFYNPRTKEMFLIREDPKSRGFLARLFGRPEFDPDEQRTTLAHEMTHALADQHFDLLGLDAASANNDDLSTAISGLVEGEATLVMMAEMMDDPTGDLLTHLDPKRVDMAFTFMSTMMPLFGGKTLRSAPPIFRESLIFPYHKGTVFVAELTRRGGWKAIDEAFLRPPVSTEQILHPEKFFGERDDPMAIELPKFTTETVGEGWTLVGENVLGELQIGVLLDKMPRATAATEGWDGDRYAVWEHRDGRLGLIWFTTWDSPNDAREFAATASQWLLTKALRQAAGDGPPPENVDNVFQRWEQEPERTEWQHETGSSMAYVALRDADVIVVDGFATDVTPRIAAQCRDAQKAPFTLVRMLPDETNP